jgi:hypothetical protein
MADLWHLIYVSTATASYDVAALDKMLESAARHNAPQHITGMLLYAGGNFMQVLEGEKDAVDETYGRIARDSRHTDLHIVENERIAERSFSKWSMGFRRLGAAEAATHPAYAPFFAGGFDAAGIGAKPGLALEILKSFGINQR